MIDADFGADGLIPAVVQDAATRSEMWEKGATSGNYLNVVSINTDCDRDALLIQVRPEGPTCHTGSTSCFGGETNSQGFAELENLWATIVDRLESPPSASQNKNR